MGTIQDKRYGLTLPLPAGFQGKQFPAGFVFGHPDITGLLLLLFHRNKSLEALKTDMYAGFFDESGFNIQVDGHLQDISDSMVIANYTGTADNQPAVGFGIGLLSPYGGGALLIAIAKEHLFGDEHMDAAEDLAKAIEWSEPEMASGDEEWVKFLQRKTIRRMQEVADLRTPAAILFGEDDAFQAAYIKAGVAFTFESFASGGANLSGQWEVNEIMEDFYLRLIFFDGHELQFKLAMEDDHLMMNDIPWLIEEA